MSLIRHYQMNIPIIQGGMGVISTVNCGYRESDFDTNPLEANKRALRKEIEFAKNYAQGNGIVAIAPIVSSGKAAKVIVKSWEKEYGIIPDFLVIEGPMAGGHLGFKKDALIAGTAQTTDEILHDVIRELAPFEQAHARKIPKFVAGGVFDGTDMARLIQAGATGVQIATRFIATEECDASMTYKQMIIDAKPEDAVLVPSPVGLPGRALIKAVKGNVEDGLFFCGSNVGRVNKLTTVPELIKELITECNELLCPN